MNSLNLHFKGTVYIYFNTSFIPKSLECMNYINFNFFELNSDDAHKVIEILINHDIYFVIDVEYFDKYYYVYRNDIQYIDTVFDTFKIMDHINKGCNISVEEFELCMLT